MSDRQLAREIAQQVHELSIQRNRRIAELEQERDEAREVASEAFAAVTEAQRAALVDEQSFLVSLAKSEARLREAEEALRPYLRQHDLADRDRHCVCSYCNAARAVLELLPRLGPDHER